MSIMRPKRKRTVNRTFISGIFIAYFILLVIYVMNRQYWQIEGINTSVQYGAVGLVGVIAGVLIYKIYLQIKRGRES